MNINFKKLIPAILFPIAVGGLAGFLTQNSVEIYEELNLPPISPPSAVFPIMWGIIYLLMGVSSYIIWNSESLLKDNALQLYGIQLIINFIWPIIFFGMGNFWLALIVIILLWGFILKMILEFSAISKVAGRIQFLYLLWVTFATYLNIGILLLN